MTTYRYSTVVDKDGFVHLSGLPPDKEVEVVILERSDTMDETQE